MASKEYKKHEHELEIVFPDEPFYEDEIDRKKKKIEKQKSKVRRGAFRATK